MATLRSYEKMLNQDIKAFRRRTGEAPKPQFEPKERPGDKYRMAPKAAPGAAKKFNAWQGMTKKKRKGY